VQTDRTLFCCGTIRLSHWDLQNFDRPRHRPVARSLNAEKAKAQRAAPRNEIRKKYRSPAGAVEGALRASTAVRAARPVSVDARTAPQPLTD
jgi:hypothetical protein